MSAKPSARAAPLALFRGFKANLNGWGDVTYTEFKDEIAPLRTRSTWGEADATKARDLTRRGAGFALRQLCAGSPARGAYAALFGTAPEKPDPPREEVAERMRNLMKSCRASCWTVADYQNYLAILNTGERPGESGLLSSSAEKDEFGAMYRAGSPAFRDFVAGFFTSAAKEAPLADPPEKEADAERREKRERKAKESKAR